MPPLNHLCFVASAFILALGSVLAKALLSSAVIVIAQSPFLTLQLLGGVSFLVGGAGLDGADRVAGLVFAGISTVYAALYVVWMRGSSRDLDVLPALITVQTVSLLVAAASWALVFSLNVAETRIGSWRLVVSAIAVGVMYHGLAFYVYLIGSKNTEASIAGVYLSLTPVFANGLAGVFLPERLTPVQWFGAGIVIGAVTGVSALDAYRRNRTGSSSRPAP